MTGRLLDKAGWVALIGDFVAGRLDGACFEQRFSDATRTATNVGESVPYAVDLLFYDLDAYSADPALRGEGDNDGDSLRSVAQQLLARIDEPWPILPGQPRTNRWTTSAERSRGSDW